MSNIILKHIIDISNNSIASRSSGGSSSGGSVTSIHMCQSQASHSSQSHSQSPVRVISKGLNIGRDRGRDNIHNQYISNTNTSSNAIINTNPDFESNMNRILLIYIISLVVPLVVLIIVIIVIMVG